MFCWTPIRACVLDLWTLVGQMPPNAPSSSHPIPPVHLTPPAGPVPAQGQTYWLGVSPKADDTYATWYWNPTDDQGTNAYRLSPAGAWTLQEPVHSGVFRVDVSPEPATVGLLGLGWVALLVRRRRGR